MGKLMDFTGKVALITGARSGVGQASAVLFAQQGARVVCAGRKACDETLAKVKEVGGEGIFVACDVSKQEDVENLIAMTIKEYGRLDVAVNCAGCPAPPARLADQTVGDYDHIMDTDARGIFLSMKYEIPEILKAGGGAIVNVASVAGLVADPDMGPYAGAKHAVVGMTQAAGIEYAKDNIRINCVCPGLIASEMGNELRAADPEKYKMMEELNWQNRAATPEEIANVCLFLGSEMATFVNGVAIPVDAGQTAH